MTLKDTEPHFKVTPMFDAEYVINVTIVTRLGLQLIN